MQDKGPSTAEKPLQEGEPERDLLRVFHHLFLFRWKWGACPQGLDHGTLRFETKLGDHRVTKGESHVNLWSSCD